MSDDGEPQLGLLEDRIVTVPNLISLARLACIPWFLWLLFEQEDRFGAAIVWAAVGATDWVDGWWARRFDVVSELGKLIDPLADRAVLIIGVLAVGVDGSVPWWLVGATLVREVAVAIAAVVLGALGARRIDVTWFGKTSRFGLMFVFPLFLVSYADVSWSETAEVLAWVIGIPSLVLHYYAAYGYIPIAIAALREGRVSDSIR